MCFQPKVRTSTSTENPVSALRITRTSKKTRLGIALVALVGFIASIFMLASPANAAVTPVTKKCTTTVGGVAQPWYLVDSMWVTRSYYNGKWTYRLERTPNRTVKYSSGGSWRYAEHHIDTIQMYSTYYAGKTVNYPSNVTYFTSTNGNMDFYMKAHVTDSQLQKFPTCRIYF